MSPLRGQGWRRGGDLITVQLFLQSTSFSSRYDWTGR